MLLYHSSRHISNKNGCRTAVCQPKNVDHIVCGIGKNPNFTAGRSTILVHIALRDSIAEHTKTKKKKEKLLLHELDGLAVSARYRTKGEEFSYGFYIEVHCIKCRRLYRLINKLLPLMHFCNGKFSIPAFVEAIFQNRNS